jgi:hypothetical protein
VADREADSDANAFGQDQRVAWAGAGISPDIGGAAQPDHRETINRLGRVDRTAARDGDARVGAD